MTDKDIEIALEICPSEATLGKCGKCPYFLSGMDCFDLMAKDALAYINRLKAENEELKVAEQCLNALTKCFCTKGDDEE